MPDNCPTAGLSVGICGLFIFWYNCPLLQQVFLCLCTHGYQYGEEGGEGRQHAVGARGLLSRLTRRFVAGREPTVLSASHVARRFVSELVHFNYLGHTVESCFFGER